MFIINIKTSIIFNNKLINCTTIINNNQDVIDITIDINTNLISEISYNKYHTCYNMFYYYKIIMNNKNEYIISPEEYENTILPSIKGTL
ncbi:MAG: hypothetical protein M0R17_04995 [Candidatus Omnitrophica bacterium]|jgi:hypothetical protein|nr:hypothetical protein [Candidatus Omnitrophota bacterium]